MSSFPPDPFATTAPMPPQPGANPYAAQVPPGFQTPFNPQWQSGQYPGQYPVAMNSSKTGVVAVVVVVVGLLAFLFLASIVAVTFLGTTGQTKFESVGSMINETGGTESTVATDLTQPYVSLTPNLEIDFENPRTGSTTELTASVSGYIDSYSSTTASPYLDPNVRTIAVDLTITNTSTDIVLFDPYSDVTLSVGSGFAAARQYDGFAPLGEVMDPGETQSGRLYFQFNAAWPVVALYVTDDASATSLGAFIDLQ